MRTSTSDDPATACNIIGWGALSQPGHDLTNGLRMEQRASASRVMTSSVPTAASPVLSGVALAGSWLGDTAHLLAGGGPVGLGNGARSVDRAVVDDEDLDGARIVPAGDAGNRLRIRSASLRAWRSAPGRDRDGRAGTSATAAGGPAA